MTKSFCGVVYILSATLVSILLSTSLANADGTYAFEAAYTGEIWANVEGGIEKDEAYIDILDLTLEVDAEEAWGLQGGTFFGYAFFTGSGNLSENIVGDAQTVSNIDNSSVFRVMELWYEQAFGNDQSLRFGLYDLNSEFDAIDRAGLFINSSHGIGAEYAQSGENGPSIYPVSSLTLRYFHSLNDHFSYRLAVLDAVPGDPDDEDKNTIDLSSDDGALIAFELNYQTDRQRFGLGTWHYTEKTEEISGGSDENNGGFFAFIDHKILSADSDGRDLSAYLRYGIAKDSVNQLDSYLGAGIVYTGFMDSRPNDSIGFAIAKANNGDDYRNATPGSESSETNLELTYRIEISDRITLQPDIQYIINPGTDSSLDDALVIGLRFELSLF